MNILVWRQYNLFTTPIYIVSHEEITIFLKKFHYTQELKLI